jgi:hypothetical protein
MEMTISVAPSSHVDPTTTIVATTHFVASTSNATTTGGGVVLDDDHWGGSEGGDDANAAAATACLINHCPDAIAACDNNDAGACMLEFTTAIASGNIPALGSNAYELYTCFRQTTCADSSEGDACEACTATFNACLIDPVCQSYLTTVGGPGPEAMLNTARDFACFVLRL